MIPIRIQRHRTKGWRMPEGAIYVGRPTKWGNPYQQHDVCSPDQVVAMFTWYAKRRAEREPNWLDPLRGHDLACWCPLVDDQGNPVPCHADVLLGLANRPRESPQCPSA